MAENPIKKIDNAIASGSATPTPQSGMAITFGEIPKERLDMILDLRRRGFHTHLLSNTNDLHWEEIKRLYFSTEGYTCADLFDNIFLSQEMHLAKPDPEIYHVAIRQIGRPAEQCLFVDDTLINVEAARREGLQGAWLDLSKETICELIRRVVS